MAGLTELTTLGLYDTNILDISAVAGLTELTDLWLGGDNISDISAVAGLTELKGLWLVGNNISDISAVAGLTELTSLWLAGNNISDISAVAGLTELIHLSLDDNNISDVSPLVANTGWGSGDQFGLREEERGLLYDLRNGDQVWLRENPLSYASIKTHIPALQSRGVTVDFDNQAHPALLKISGDNQNGVFGAALSTPLVVELQDENGSTLAGVSVTFAVVAGGGTLSTQTTTTDENGRAQTTLTLGPNLGTNAVKVSAVGIEGRVTFHAIADTAPSSIAADVTGDGVVNIFDLVSVAAELGKANPNSAADVNGDGKVDIFDLVLVAGMFAGEAAAPSAVSKVPETLTAVEVQQWLTEAMSLEVKDAIMKRGITVLEQLLVSLTPIETALLANYPNPFNPETWIPYRLAADAFVTLSLYDSMGRVVRKLDVGHRVASAYESRSKAIYWDGRNDVGERVASGVYFYHLSAGDYTAARRMVILK